MRSLYTIGQNDNGQLGLGHVESTTDFTKLEMFNNPQNIHCGSNHIIYVNSNKIYCCGDNKYGQCAIDNSNKLHTEISSLKEITFFKKNGIKIKKIFTSINSDSTFWLTSNNKLYANGYNYYRNLGLNDNKNRYKPTLINIPFTASRSIIDIKMSHKYTLLLCYTLFDKLVISMMHINKIKSIVSDIISVIKLFYGKNPNKVLSSMNQFNDGKFHQISDLKDINIIKIETGYDYSLFLDEFGILYSCGDNKYCQLGYIEYRGYTSKPQRVIFNLNIKIKDISCGLYHNLSIDYDNKIYSWGLNDASQCGFSSVGAEVVKTPQMLKSFRYQKVVEIGCGAYHSYVQTSYLKHYLFGDNQYSQCIKMYCFEVLPYLINVSPYFSDKLIKNVFCGKNSTLFITENSNK